MLANGAEVVTDLGAGPPVVLLHGVGVGPSSFDAVVDHLVVDHRVVVLRRPVPGAGGSSVDEQALSLASTVAALHAGPCAVAGVSGGATLALALAMVAPELVRAAVVHEPLLGEHAPALHERVQVGAAALAAGELAPTAWFRGLVGEPTWAALPPGVDGGEVVADDVAGFAAWAPGAERLAALQSLPLVTTVGARSDIVRRDAARALRRLADARVVFLPGAGHLPQLEQPAAFAAVVADVAR